MKIVKTALELSMLNSENHNNVCLLGAWCLNKSENILKDSERFDIATYHWDDRKKYNYDYLYLTNVYEEKLSLLAPILNEIHSIEKDVRYWRIVVGPWLRFFIDALFDRYECIKASKEYSKASHYELYTYKLNEWCPCDFKEFMDDLTSEEWNEIIFSECILSQNIPFKIAKQPLSRSKKSIKESILFVDKWKDVIKWLSSKYSELLGPKYRGSVVVGSYSSFRTIFKLYLGLFQIPYFSLPIVKIKGSEVNKSMRRSLAISENSSGFEAVLEKLLPAMMPKIYLEDFAELRAKISMRFPEKPKSIFTANLYQSDDVFKVWAADRSASGVPLIIGQHGGNFSIALHNQTVDHQLKIADKFVSWGWDKDMEDHVVKLPSLQLAETPCITPDFQGQVLHILTSLPRYFYCHYSVPVASQFLSYLQDQLDFFDRLESTVIEKLNIRPDLNQSARGWNVKRVIENAGYDNKLDKSGGSIIEAIKASRICICTSNSTVFLQTLAMNFPTVVFWDNNHNEISPDAQHHIDLLVEAKILFFNPIEAAIHVNETISNVSNWWFSHDVQVARELFCKRYAFNSPDWADGWVRFLK